MKKVCKDCKYYKEHREGFWIFKIKKEVCTHDNAKDIVTGEPQDCSLVRILSKDCGGQGNWFEEKE
jgi:hypothetical protein